MRQTFHMLFYIGIAFYCTTNPILLMSQINDSLSYTLFDTKNGIEISLREVVEKIQDIDVIFFGEEHGDTIAHQLQSELLKLLFENRNGAVVLSMEMFERDGQLVLDEYLKGIIQEKNLIKDARAWDNYERDYKPMIEFAKEHQIPVIAANAPRRYVSLVNRKGTDALEQLPKEAYSFLPPIPYQLLEGPYLEKFNKAMGGSTDHSGSNIYASQNLWDATMANSIAAHWKKNKNDLIFHLNGRFHSDHRLGTVAHLENIRPKIRTFTISCFPSDAPDAISPPKFDHIADIVIVH